MADIADKGDPPRQDGNQFIRQLANFIRAHEAALADSLQKGRTDSKNQTSDTGVLKTVLSVFKSKKKPLKEVKLSLTDYQLAYILSRFQLEGLSYRTDWEQDHGAFTMDVLQSSWEQSSLPGSSIASVSSHESLMSIFSRISKASKSASISLASSYRSLRKYSFQPFQEVLSEDASDDLSYINIVFTEIPSLRLSPDNKAPLIQDFEYLSKDPSVPLTIFKDLQALEIKDLDFRQFSGLNILADQLKSLTLNRALVDNLGEIINGAGRQHFDESPRISSSEPFAIDSIGTRDVDSLESISLPPLSFTDELSLNFTTETAHPGGSHDPSNTDYIPSNQSLTRRYISEPNSSYEPIDSGIQEKTWRSIKHLALPNNNLRDIRPSELSGLSTFFASLDLSFNSFENIPNSLSTLPNLSALNISNCRVRSLHNLLKNPLSKVRALNLRNNELNSLAGVERLTTLERLDLRGNRLTDPLELARLTASSAIREVWVDGNPFSKSHRDYRVMIFKLFRTCPGFSEDILIDDTGPTKSELKRILPHASADLPPVLASSSIHRKDIAQQKGGSYQRRDEKLKSMDAMLELARREINTSSTSPADPLIKIEAGAAWQLEESHLSEPLNIHSYNELLANKKELLNLTTKFTETEGERSEKNSTIAADQNPRVIGYEKALEGISEDILHDLKYEVVHHNGECWTCSPIDSISTDIVPLHIHGVPVVIPVESHFPLTPLLSPPPDPHPIFIDPNTQIKDGIVKAIFNTYQDALGFYLLINGVLQIIVADDFDYEYALAHSPRRFGGLEVSYILESMTPTAGVISPASEEEQSLPTGSLTSPSGLVTPKMSSPSSRPVAQFAMTFGGSIQASVKGNKLKERFEGRVGVMTKSGNKTFLTIPTHVATAALTAAKSSSFPGSSWPRNVQIVSSNGSKELGPIRETFDPQASHFPLGFEHDVSLVDVSSSPAELVAQIKAPIPTSWLSTAAWQEIKYQTTRLHLLNHVTAPAQQETRVKSIGLLDCQCQAVGQGIFRMRQPPRPSRFSLRRSSPQPDPQQEAEKWTGLVARSLLFRIHPNIRHDGVQSGNALCVLEDLEDGTRCAKVAGFTAFAQDVSVVQNFDLDGPRLYSRLEQGRVAFYGAFQVPEKLKEEHYIV